MAITESYLKALANLGLAADTAGAARCRERFKLEHRVYDLVETEARALHAAVHAQDGLRLKLQDLQTRRDDLEAREAHDYPPMPAFTGQGEILKINLPENRISAKAHKTKELAHLDALILAVREEINGKDERRRHVSARVGSLRFRLQRCELMLNGKTALAFAPAPPDIKKNSGIREVEAERTTIQNLRADLREVEALPLAAAVRRAKAEASLSKFSARPRIDELGVWHFPKSSDMLSWMLKELKLDQKIYSADIEDDKKTGAVTDAERQRRIKQIDAEILLANRREETLVRMMLEACEDQIIPRRDSDVKAILGLADDVVVPRDALGT
jgi:hypothetical protein